MNLWRKFRDLALACLVTAVYWILSRFWFVRHVNAPKILDSRETYVGAHWHGDELLLLSVYWHRQMAVMASRSKDGELLTRFLRWTGYYVVRGSSTRGGAGGLKGLIDAVQQGHVASLAVDGPRGPIYRVKPGVLKLAQETGRPIVPGAAAASRRFVFKRAWNRCYLPLPLARCVIVYGDPLVVPPDLSETEFESLRLDLERRLLALKADAEARFSREFQTPSLSKLSAEPTGV